MKKIAPFVGYLIVFLCLAISCKKETKKKATPEPIKKVEELADIQQQWLTTPEAIKATRTGSVTDLYRMAEVDTFYTSRGDSAVWTTPALRRTVLKLLEGVKAEGLFPEYYHVKEIKKRLRTDQELDTTGIAQLDVLLTDAVLGYAHDLWYGRLDPKSLYRVWGVSREKRKLAAGLKEAIASGDLTCFFESLRPSHPVYSGLKRSLKEYEEKRNTETIREKIPEGDFIEPGQKDPRIPAIATRLKDLGYPVLKMPTDSTYNFDVQEAIAAYQDDQGLQVDRIIGNSTIVAFNTTAEQRYKQILANLERWRWYPRNLGSHYILINIPQFRLAVVKEGDTIRTHNIIAGTRERQTPVFSDSLQYIVINPQWTLPPTIKTKDVIPMASRNPSYLRSHNMMVMNKTGEILDPDNINWGNPEVSDLTFIQRAGPSNPLGRVKIIYPNPYLVYLHDTPAQSLFSQNQRAESSGCVRVQEAVDLAAYVLSNQERWQEDRIKEAIASGRTMQVKINRPIHVHHFYWTAWRAGDHTRFTEDVYRLDRGVWSRLLDNN